MDVVFGDDDLAMMFDWNKSMLMLMMYSRMMMMMMRESIIQVCRFEGLTRIVVVVVGGDVWFPMMNPSVLSSRQLVLSSGKFFVYKFKIS